MLQIHLQLSRIPYATDTYAFDYSYFSEACAFILLLLSHLHRAYNFFCISGYRD